MNTAPKTTYWRRINWLLPENFIGIFLVLQGAMLMAIQIRLQVNWGQRLGGDYVPTSLLLTLVLGIAAGMATLTFWGSHHAATLSRKQRELLAFGVGLGVSSALILLVLPDISKLQVSYFIFFSALFGIITIGFAPTLRAYGKPVTVAHHFRVLWEYRALIAIWIRYNVYSRYSQTFMGILWIILMPLSTTLVIAFVFSQVLRFYDIGDIPFISFFLCALTFWNIFNQGVVLGMHSLVTKMGLITQVYFPREIIVIAKIGETAVDLSFMFIAMIVINAVLGVYPNANYVYLPFIFLIQWAFTLGVAFFLSYLSVLIRDIPNLVGVLLQFLFYLTPIVYPADRIPAKFHGIILANPMAPLIDAYRRIILYDRPPHFVNLHYPIVIAGLMLYMGYLFFKSRESVLADFV